MGEIILPRRKFLIGSLATLFVAPAVIRSGALMPVKSFAETIAGAIDPLMDLSDFHTQFADFKKRFLVEYRKAPDAEAARGFDIAKFAGKWAGTATYQSERDLTKRKWLTTFDVT